MEIQYFPVHSMLYIFAMILGNPIYVMAQITSKGRELLVFVSGNVVVVGGGDTSYSEWLENIYSKAVFKENLEINLNFQLIEMGRFGIDCHQAKSSRFEWDNFTDRFEAPIVDTFSRQPNYIDMRGVTIQPRNSLLRFV